MDAERIATVKFDLRRHNTLLVNQWALKYIEELEATAEKLDRLRRMIGTIEHYATTDELGEYMAYLRIRGTRFISLRFFEELKELLGADK
jgi:hypothetical protein